MIYTVSRNCDLLEDCDCVDSFAAGEKLICHYFLNYHINNLIKELKLEEDLETSYLDQIKNFEYINSLIIDKKYSEAAEEINGITDECEYYIEEALESDFRSKHSKMYSIDSIIIKPLNSSFFEKIYKTEIFQ